MRKTHIVILGLMGATLLNLMPYITVQWFEFLTSAALFAWACLTCASWKEGQ
jgi:hypothetical protein